MAVYTREYTRRKNRLTLMYIKGRNGRLEKITLTQKKV